MTVIRIWNQWVQDSNTGRRAGSRQLFFTSSEKNKHVTLMALKDPADTSRAPSQELGSIARQQMSARTVRRRLQQNGLSA
ncbi:hypothetical protein TNCV_27821 [Trichonephila clavipes]|uniref:Transposase Tc1-like domain-containing protein n=1 Tax=Trichonephila clavipes TaxID=2585209 RepID=A0A8X6WK11_TRICX|nr:hypothetical protein TNCV_27821 [Trichonephila clavipes]